MLKGNSKKCLSGNSNKEDSYWKVSEIPDDAHRLINPRFGVI